MRVKVESRLDQIIHVVVSARDGGGVTRKEICDAIGLKKSPYTIDLIEKCVSDGWLESHWGIDAILPYKFYTPSTMTLAKVG